MFPYKSIRDQIWSCHKIGQGQPSFIIWANVVVLKHPMKHTKFQDHQPFGSREEDFLRFLPYMGLAAMWPVPLEQTFVPPSHRSSIWNLTLTDPVVSEEKMLKSVADGRRRRTTEVYLTCRLTKWAYGSGELKNIQSSDPIFKSKIKARVVFPPNTTPQTGKPIPAHPLPYHSVLPPTIPCGAVLCPALSPSHPTHHPIPPIRLPLPWPVITDQCNSNEL